jgi:ketosteroid isomerase-like protein
VESSSSPVRNNIAVVRKAADAWNKRDWTTALGTIDPQVEWRNSGVVPGIEDVYHGHEGVLRFWDAWIETWDDMQIDFEEFVERGEDDVIALARFRARGRDGLEVDQPVAFHFVIGPDGLLKRFQSYWNRDDAPLDRRTSDGRDG